MITKVGHCIYVLTFDYEVGCNMPNSINLRNRDARLRVLLLDCRPETAALVTGELERAGHQVYCERVDGKDAFVQSLRIRAPDLILAAPGLPGFDALDALRVVRVLRPAAPLIVVADAFDAQTAVTCLRAGVENVVLRSNLSRLVPATRKALSLRQPLKRLSRRQLEVLQLVSEGRTTRQIAERLSVSVKTAETHRGAMSKRLGIREIAQQARYAVRVGLVSENPSNPEPAAA